MDPGYAKRLPYWQWWSNLTNQEVKQKIFKRAMNNYGKRKMFRRQVSRLRSYRRAAQKARLPGYGGRKFVRGRGAYYEWNPEINIFGNRLGMRLGINK